MSSMAIAAAIAGSSIGFGIGFLPKSEELENNGYSLGTQIGGSLRDGLIGSAIGGAPILVPYGVYKAIGAITK